MTQKAKTPEIRFAGFTDEWEEQLVGKVADVTKLAGFEFTEYVIYSDEGSIIALRGLNVKNGALVLDDVKYIDKSDFSKLNRSKLYANDVLFTYVGTVGEVAIIPENTTYYLAPNVARIRFNDEIVPCFILQEIESEQFYNQMIFPLIATSSQPALSMQNIRKFVIQYPAEKEQKLIGNYFSSLDRLITLQQRKLERLQNVKKSMLEKMFPKAGSRVPEIRFAGFTGDWEQKKLGGIADIIGGGTPNTNNPEYWDGNIDWYAPAEIGNQCFAEGSVRKITELGLQNCSATILPAGRTILFTSRAGIGKTAILRKPGATNQGFQSLVLKDGYNPYFIYSMSDMIKEKAERVAAGSTFLEISGKMLGNLDVMLPSKGEQDKIAAFFNSLDRLVSLQQRKLEKLQNVKKAMLEKMFV